MTDIEKDVLQEMLERRKKELASCERMLELLQPEWDKFEARAGHDVYVARDYADHFSAARTHRKEIAALDAAIAAMQPAPQEPVGSAAEITRLTEALRAADEREKGLRDAVISAAEWLRNAPLESGVCCCGDPIETHGYYSGHSPVDAVAYSAMQLRDELLAALKGPSHDDA